MVTVSGDGSSFHTTALGGGVNTSFQAEKIEGNFLVGHGQNGQQEQGLAWELSDLSHPTVTRPFLVSGAEDVTLNFGVNASGDFVGTSGAGLVATIGNIPANSATALSSPEGSSAIARDISAAGLVVGTVVEQGSSSIQPVVWTGTSAYSVLPTNTISQGFARSVSASGNIIGGSFGIFDSISETLRFQAAIWSGQTWSTLTALTNEDGTPFFGEVLGVTDNGDVVGRSDGGGFIWNTSWAAPLLFNQWAQTELGLTIPTWVVSVNDVFYDGAELSFALQGSAYLVRAPAGQTAVPEPATILFVISSFFCFGAYRQASTPIISRSRRI